MLVATVLVGLLMRYPAIMPLGRLLLGIHQKQLYRGKYNFIISIVSNTLYD